MNSVQGIGLQQQNRILWCAVVVLLCCTVALGVSRGTDSVSHKPGNEQETVVVENHPVHHEDCEAVLELEMRTLPGSGLEIASAPNSVNSVENPEEDVVLVVPTTRIDLTDRTAYVNEEVSEFASPESSLVESRNVWGREEPEEDFLAVENFAPEENRDYASLVEESRNTTGSFAENRTTSPAYANAASPSQDYDFSSTSVSSLSQHGFPQDLYAESNDYLPGHSDRNYSEMRSVDTQNRNAPSYASNSHYGNDPRAGSNVRNPHSTAQYTAPNYGQEHPYPNREVVYNRQRNENYEQGTMNMVNYREEIPASQTHRSYKGFEQPGNYYSSQNTTDRNFAARDFQGTGAYSYPPEQPYAAARADYGTGNFYRERSPAYTGRNSNERPASYYENAPQYDPGYEPRYEPNPPARSAYERPVETGIPRYLDRY